MKTYYISKSTHIDNPYFLIFANVVDEEIVTQSLTKCGYSVIQTSTMIDSVSQNFKKHIDIIYEDENCKKHYVDVKTPGDKYITISKTLIRSNVDKNNEFAIIYEDRIYFAKVGDILKHAKQSKYNGEMMYVTIGEFMSETSFIVKIDKQLQEYRKKQILLKDKILKETRMCRINDAMRIAEDALQDNYYNMFDENFSIKAI